MEGILGFVWGGGKKWVGDKIHDTAGPLLPDSGAVDGDSSGYHRRRGDIRSAETGTVYTRSTRESVYPKIVQLARLNYTNDGRGDLIYRAADGETLGFHGSDGRVEVRVDSNRQCRDGLGGR